MEVRTDVLTNVLTDVRGDVHMGIRGDVRTGFLMQYQHKLQGC